MQWLLMLIVLLVIAALIWWWWRLRSAASTASSGGAAAVAPAPMPLPSAAKVDADPAAVNVDLADPWRTDVVGGDDLADDASVDVGGGDGTDESSWAEEPASDDGPVFHADAVVDTVDTVDTVEGVDVVDTDESVAPAPRGLTAVGAVADGTFGPGSADPADDGSGPDGYDIKANADSMLFHTTDSPYYGRTTAEVWFDSESSAEAAGFTRWDDRGQNAGGSSEDGDTVADDSPTAPQGIVSVARVPDGAFGPGSADPAEDGSGPDGYDIKGNADSMLYHTVESRYYGVTKADVWFETEEAARNAGFRNVDD